MSIFINNEAKENFKGFWFGLAIPILVGVGLSTVSITVLINSDLLVPHQYTFIGVFIILFAMSGHLVVWPLLAWRLIRRANKVQNLPRKKGAWLSLKLYMIWVTWIVVAGFLESA